MNDSAKNAGDNSESLDFVREIVSRDCDSGRYDGKVHTRFPPEPNAYLHIGHAKAIWLNYSIAKQFDGLFNLRLDDTNPIREEQEYVDAIVEDMKWLGVDWSDRLFYASDYFGQLYQWATKLIETGNAYVCDLSADEVREYRGSLNAPGKDSPYRHRDIQENLDLFKKMKAGQFEDGSRSLRAKIDMAAANLNLRDPVMYRIMRATHHRTGDKWCIYPTYDFTHGQSDSIEGITHSICSLEFENHRPLYDWYLDTLGVHHPQQIEFGRFNLTYTIMSKRKLLRLVEANSVDGWDDPRLPTLRGMRRRGYTPEAIRQFMSHISVSKFTGTIEIAMLEHFLRQDLNQTSNRVLAVLNPLKVIIDNYPDDVDDAGDQLIAANNPSDESAGTRTVPFSKEIYIEREDFMEDPPKKFFRLAPGREVRLRYAYFITCTDVVKNDDGEIIELHCTYDPKTRGGDSPDGRKVKATLHWVSATEGLPAEIRLYDNLFTEESPEAEGDFMDKLSPESKKILTNCIVEPSVADAKPETRYQFERQGYFCVDKDSKPDKLVFNRTVALRDSYAKKKKSR